MPSNEIGLEPVDKSPRFLWPYGARSLRLAGRLQVPRSPVTQSCSVLACGSFVEASQTQPTHEPDMNQQPLAPSMRMNAQSLEYAARNIKSMEMAIGGAVNECFLVRTQKFALLATLLRLAHPP